MIEGDFGSPSKSVCRRVNALGDVGVDVRPCCSFDGDGGGEGSRFLPLVAMLSE